MTVTAMSTSIRFLVARLKNATFVELLHRAIELFSIARLKWQVRQGGTRLTVPHIDVDGWRSLKMPMFMSNLTPFTLDDLLQGAVCTLNTDLEATRKFETRLRSTFSAGIVPKIDAPDLRAVWEPARLQHAAALIIHTQVNPGGERTAECLEYARDCILEWLENNPFLYGPHYASAMECGLRIPVFFYLLKCVPLNPLETATVLDAIYHHAWWVERRLSLYSSLGNHTICEAVGLIFAGALFRKMAGGRNWLDRGTSLLRQELDHQVLPDGGPIEQSLNYHRFVLDLYWLAVDFLKQNGLEECSGFSRRLVAGEEFLAAFRDESGNVPFIGDSDDGRAVATWIAPLRNFPEEIGKSIATHDESGYSIVHFAEAGYTVVRRPDGMVLTIDHGPLGMPPFNNHGHADALSITLSLSGEPLLVDPGTYRYSGVPGWRSYFRGTRAHNTICIDGLDQAVQETGFIWSRPYRTKLHGLTRLPEGGILLDTSHDGYTRLKCPVTHRRKLLLTGSFLLVKDTFTGSGMHDYELNFHLHPNAVTEERDGWWQIQKGKTRIVLTLFSGGNFTLIQGREIPPLGWYSPEYGIKAPCGVLQAHRNGEPTDVSFLAAINLDGRADPENTEWLAEAFCTAIVE